MQEDILKFGVRTRKRNKSIKESAKLVILDFYLTVSPQPELFPGSGEHAYDPHSCGGDQETNSKGPNIWRGQSERGPSVKCLKYM